MNKTSPLFRLLKMETLHSKQPGESADPTRSRALKFALPLPLLTPATQADALVSE